MSAYTIVRPVFRKFTSRWLSRAATYVKKGGHAVIERDDGALDLILGVDEHGKITELGLWAILAQQQPQDPSMWEMWSVNYHLVEIGVEVHLTCSHVRGDTRTGSHTIGGAPYKELASLLCLRLGGSRRPRPVSPRGGAPFGYRVCRSSPAVRQ